MQWTISDDERACFAPDWAFSRELEAALSDLLRDRKPAKVLELGAGLSSVLLLKYAAATGANTIHLEQAGVAYGNLLGCLRMSNLPIAPVRLCDVRNEFYDVSPFADLQTPFDLVIIDGPRGSRARTCAKAVEFLQRVIGPRSAVIVDDTNRAPEAKLAWLIERWFGENHFKHVDVRDKTFTHRSSTLLNPKSNQRPSR